MLGSSVTFVQVKTVTPWPRRVVQNVLERCYLILKERFLKLIYCHVVRVKLIAERFVAVRHLSCQGVSPFTQAFCRLLTFVKEMNKITHNMHIVPNGSEPEVL